jgi:hypothetical protein
MNKLKYQLGKYASRKTGYPMATIAYYGPNDKFASKAVVGIVSSPNAKDKDTEVKRWFTTDVDARLDQAIMAEMLAYIELKQARRVARMDRIIGCPHEEGIDYPDGEVCPQCPFWANRDRWTGEIIS